MTNSIKLRIFLVLHLGLWPLESNFAVTSTVLPSRKPPQTEVRISKSSLNEDQKIIHTLNRFGFGPRPGDIEKVRKMGLPRYFDLQLQPDKIRDPVVEDKLKGLNSLGMSSTELIQNYPQPRQLANSEDPREKRDKDKRESRMSEGSEKPEPQEKREPPVNLVGPRRVIYELSQAKVLRAIYSERQLLEVMVDFWHNHFNVFAAKGADKWLITSYDRDVIRPYALGKFEDLLMATAKSPAMLFYLDNWLSSDPNATVDASKLKQIRSEQRLSKETPGFGFPRRGLKGNGSGHFPRFSLEKTPSHLNPKPQIQLPKNRMRGLNENYARELMELHTLGVDGGYTQKDVTEVARCFTGWTVARPRQGAEFVFAKYLHDDGEKVVLGRRIPAGGGIKDGAQVIDILVHHPSTARFIATKLAVHFVSDHPPQALVNRIAETFRKTDGDIPSLLKTIFFSSEFFAADSYRVKVKTPFEVVVSAIRSLGAETDAGRPILQAIAQMGEPLFLCQPPTGYPDAAEAWVNTGALLNRLNFGLALAANRIPGTQVDLQKFARLQAQESDEAILQDFTKLLLQNDISDQTLAALKKQLKEAEDKADLSGGPGNDKGTMIVGLLLGSPEFQRQ